MSRNTANLGNSFPMVAEIESKGDSIKWCFSKIIVPKNPFKNYIFGFFEDFQF